MKLIVGLGNPGDKYKNSKHNIGFMILDHFVKDFKIEKKLETEIIKDKDIIYAKPQTFMNESGRAVSKIAQYYKVKPKDVIIIVDDKDLPFGKLRIRKEGSSGGHNGLKSIIEYLGTKDFTRLRVGILDPDKKIKDTSKYVIKDFSRKQKKELSNIIENSQQAIESILHDGIDRAMQKFN
ncbi:MAG: aminoacyl-tRNA hydrolase [Patescibacteria group bacterium]|nr:aminoacyl-tRNA hydrolase [Patescibacteria group bacterium]